MVRDIRFALRQLAAAKAFTITAMVTLALGIGANTGIFTLVNALMMKSLPVADPQRIVRLGDGDNCCVIGGLQGRFSIYSYPLYQYLREHTPEFEEMSAFQGGVGPVRDDRHRRCAGRPVEEHAQCRAVERRAVPGDQERPLVEVP